MNWFNRVVCFFKKHQYRGHFNFTYNIVHLTYTCDRCGGVKNVFAYDTANNGE